MMEFRGVYAAAITPRGKQGEVDFGAAFELIDFLCQAGVRGIVLFGAAGEYPAFRVLGAAAAWCTSHASVAGSLFWPAWEGATLDASAELASNARDGGADAVLIPPPLFFRYGEHDLRDFFCSSRGRCPGCRSWFPILPRTQPRSARSLRGRALPATGRLPESDRSGEKSPQNTEGCQGRCIHGDYAVGTSPGRTSEPPGRNSSIGRTTASKRADAQHTGPRGSKRRSLLHPSVGRNPRDRCTLCPLRTPADPGS